MRIEGARPPIPIEGLESGGTPDAAPQRASFEGVLEGLVDGANADQNKAKAAAEALARGATDDLHGTMISMKEAEISLKLVGSVRNKLLDAFHELWRINV
ncbi:MAG: flagellar hook-basal body complex protein FliE [Myxococcales bacterium]|jgi:flagellar hook-basal body complex protein FliE|nr:flagellar hook-basal body complex protein FliE [Myxococcales bacterium]